MDHVLYSMTGLIGCHHWSWLQSLDCLVLGVSMVLSWLCIGHFNLCCYRLAFTITGLSGLDSNTYRPLLLGRTTRTFISSWNIAGWEVLVPDQQTLCQSGVVYLASYLKYPSCFVSTSPGVPLLDIDIFTAWYVIVTGHLTPQLVFIHCSYEHISRVVSPWLTLKIVYHIELTMTHDMVMWFL